MAAALFDQSEVIEALQAEMSGKNSEVIKSPAQLWDEGWRPHLNPIQGRAVKNSAIYKLYYGERGSGKAIGALHELVEDMFINDNCLAYIVVKESGMASEGGAWHKLQNLVLPEWGRGIGLTYTSVTYDVNTKKPQIWIKNRFGGWSLITVTSLPVAHQVEVKIKGREPHSIFVDEADVLDNRTYFSSLLMQLGRDPGQTTPAKLIFVCNPQGPSHWLYKLFFEEPVNQETGEWDSRYAHFHIPYSDNEKNMPENYYRDYVDPAVRHDPILQARLKRGEWVDRPEGNALFGAHFSEAIHIRGNEVRNEGLVPINGHPCILSYDPGAAHSVVYFQQIVPTLEKIYKLIFDEFDFVGVYKPYTQLVPILIERMIYWEKKMKSTFNWLHISDDSAFNQYRAKEGSFDVWDIEKISKKYVEERELDPRFIIRMKACPKGEFSREARVRMTMDDLLTQSLLISATCPRYKEMMFRLEEDQENRMNPKKKQRYGHNFDAGSYGFFYFSTRRIEVPGKTEAVEPMYYRM